MNTLQLGDVSLSEKEGGLGRYFSELLEHLPLTGGTHHGFVVGAAEKEGAKGIRSFAHVDDPIATRLRNLRRAVASELRAFPADLLVAHFALYAVPVVDRLSTVPLVVHFHGPWAGEATAENKAGVSSKAKALVERFVYSRALQLIVLSRCFKQELIRRYGVREDRVHVISGGINGDRFNTNLSRAEARARLCWPSDRFIIFSVRRQVRRMGLEELIDAAQLLVRRTPDVLILLGGSGAITGELQARIESHGLQQHVKLLGRVDEAVLPLAYKAADLTVVPSRSLEGFGLVTLESLAAGTPVYVTAVGGLPEVIQPFAPSCIFPDASAAGMASSLQAVITGADQVPSEQACREYAFTNFAWPVIASRVHGVYERALA